MSKNKNTKTPNADIAKRALKEAKLRQIQQQKNEIKREEEIGGRKGLEPTRYGDWEKKGITSDF